MMPIIMSNKLTKIAVFSALYSYHESSKFMLGSVNKLIFATKDI